LEKEKTPSMFRKILLSRLRFIGDVVLTTPIIRAMRAAYPEAHIAYLAERKAVSLLQHNPYLNELIPYDIEKNIFSQILFYRRLHTSRYDLVIDFFGNPRTALLTYATGARVRLGLDERTRSRLYTLRVKDDRRPKTAIQFYFQFLQALGVKPTSTRTEIFLTEDERREARTYLQWNGIDVDRPIVVIHSAASWPAKVWPSDRFAQLADHIIARLGAQVILHQGPKDHQIVSEVSRRCTGTVKVLDILPLRQLAAILSHASVCVANDSGPMHIAAAVGTKTIGIFGPGEENIWFPYDPSDGHVALRKDVWCHPCHLDFCDKRGDEYMKCMSLLEVRDVFRAVEERL
jgi:predicted lipopolysaccharide heptosyltransferase III